MQPQSPRDDRPGTVLAERLDRAFSEINAYLLALAIGLAALDAASFAAMRYVDLIEHVPPLAQTAPAAHVISGTAGFAPTL